MGGSLNKERGETPLVTPERRVTRFLQGCFRTQRSRPSVGIESLDGTSLHQTITIGENQHLKHEKLKCKSDGPLTGGQLHSNRDEFVDTEPEFEEGKEISDALKATTYADETNDYALPQAIIDGPNISLLTENSENIHVSLEELTEENNYLKIKVEVLLMMLTEATAKLQLAETTANLKEKKDV